MIYILLVQCISALINIFKVNNTQLLYSTIFFSQRNNLKSWFETLNDKKNYRYWEIKNPKLKYIKVLNYCELKWTDFYKSSREYLKTIVEILREIKIKNHTRSSSIFGIWVYLPFHDSTNIRNLIMVQKTDIHIKH